MLIKNQNEVVNVYFKFIAIGRWVTLTH